MSLVNFDVLFLIQIIAYNLIHLEFFCCYKWGLKHLHSSKHFFSCLIPFSFFFLVSEDFSLRSDWLQVCGLFKAINQFHPQYKHQRRRTCQCMG